MAQQHSRCALTQTSAHAPAWADVSVKHNNTMENPENPPAPAAEIDKQLEEAVQHAATLLSQYGQTVIVAVVREDANGITTSCAQSGHKYAVLGLADVIRVKLLKHLSAD